MAFVASTGGHWYAPQPDGSVIARHDATLREARKEGLYPSVTTVNKSVRANGQLIAWLKGEIVRAVEGNPRFSGESDDDYHRRIDTASSQKASDAADFGTALHDAIEHYPNPCKDARLQPWLDAFAPWYHDNIDCAWGQEVRMCDTRIGIAGTMDFIGVHKQHGVIVADWKTAGVKKGKPSFYDSWPEQLAFYAKASQFIRGLPETPRCMSVVINRNEPERPYEKLWTNEEIQEAWRRFLCTAYTYFSSQKMGGFWPATGKPWNPAELWDI
jgi:hypothetical protein